jgi:hypothetical protein
MQTHHPLYAYNQGLVEQIVRNQPGQFELPQIQSRHPPQNTDAPSDCALRPFVGASAQSQLESDLPLLISRMFPDALPEGETVLTQ